MAHWCEPVLQYCPAMQEPVPAQPSWHCWLAGSQYWPAGHPFVTQVARSGRSPQVFVATSHAPPVEHGEVSLQPGWHVAVLVSQYSPCGHDWAVQVAGAATQLPPSQVVPGAQSVFVWQPAKQVPTVE